MPEARAPVPPELLDERIAALRVIIRHKRDIHCEWTTIDIDTLEALLDRAAPSATSGYASLLSDAPHHRRHDAEAEWAATWARFSKREPPP